MSQDNQGVTPTGSDHRPFGVEPASAVSSIAGTPNAVEAALIEAAGDSFDYASFHFYQASVGHTFFSASLHRGQICWSGIGDTVSEALERALASAPFDAEKAA